MLKSSLAKLFYINILLVFIWILAVLGTYFSVASFPYLGILGLSIPFLILSHFIFFCFWLLLRKKWMFLSLSCLLLSVVLFGWFFRPVWGSDDLEDNGLKVMSYNARGFNINGELAMDNVDNLIIDFILEQQPDILCLQEAYYRLTLETELDKTYPYKYVDFIYDGGKRERVVQAIFSRYPITHVEIMAFPKSANSTLFADINYNGSPIRLMNMHLQSFGIQPNLDVTPYGASSTFLNRIKQTLAKQEQQMALIRKALDTTSIPSVLVGDMNNTQFSRVYRTAKEGFQDSYYQAGSGFGRTFELFKLPLRIDYILADDSFKVIAHTNFDIQLSDHYPVMATMQLNN